MGHRCQVALEDGSVVGNDKVNLADCCDGQARLASVAKVATGNPRSENHGKPIGEPWENHGKMEVYRKISWENGEPLPSGFIKHGWKIPEVNGGF